MQSLVRRQVVFIPVGMLVVGCLEAVVAFGLGWCQGVEGVAYSVLLCLVPGWLTIYASDLLKHQRSCGVCACLWGPGFGCALCSRVCW